MRAHRVVSALLAVAAAVGGITPAAAVRAGAAAGYGTKTKTFDVATKYGDVVVEVARPVDRKHRKRTLRVPAVFTYSPYSVLQQQRCGDRICDADRWVPKGYARVWADVLGTGDS